MTGHNCQNCGDWLGTRMTRARMVVCDSCGSTSIIDDDVVRLAGTAGVMQDAPSLLAIGTPVRLSGLTLTPVGHARFDYGRGWWDEFCCLTADGEGWWLSADEGDYALERPLDHRDWPDLPRPTLGATVRIGGLDYRVTEAETATCLAVRGEFPEVLDVGETHDYFDLSGPDDEIATLETWSGGRAWTIGRWYDPWEVRAA